MKECSVRVRICAQIPRLFLIDKFDPSKPGTVGGLLDLTEDEIDLAILALQAAKDEARGKKMIYVVGSPGGASGEGKVMVDRGSV